MKRRWLLWLLFVLLVASAALGQVGLKRRRAASVPALAEGAYAALGGLRSIAAEVVWFRADRLQEEGRYVELAQMANLLALMEPHTPEVWSFASWNLAYNVSVMMPSHEDRWRWVEAGIRLLRDEGLALNPREPELYRELAWLFEVKIGTNLDSGAELYRARWKARIEDVRARNAWHELKMDPDAMRAIERRSGMTDWTDPQLSAVYWAMKGLPYAQGAEQAKLVCLIHQATCIYGKNHKL